MRRVFSNWLRSLNLRTKLFITIIATALTPLIAFVAVMYAYFGGALSDQTEYAAQVSLQQTRDYLGYLANEVVALTDTLIFTPSVEKIFSRSIQEAEKDIVQQYNDAREMSLLFSYMISGRQINRVRVYVQPELIYSQENFNFFDYEAVREKTWARQLLARNAKVTWFSSQELEDGLGMIAACRPIRNYADFEEHIGIMRIDLEEETLNAIVEHARSTPGARALLINSRGNLMTPVDMEDKESAALVAWARENAVAGETRWVYDAILSEKQLLGVTDVPNTDWVLLCAVPTSDISLPSRALVAPLIFILLGCAAITTLIAFLFSGNITRRVDELLDEMALLESGTFDSPAPDEQWRDDIGILSYQFHRMRGQLRRSMQEKTDALNRLRHSEVRALQAQINPHFLYNTLDFIYWSALEYGARDLADTVLALSRFYRMSLRGGQEQVPLAQELEHAATYLQILSARFENKIELFIDVREEAREVVIPRITLQPLLENAIHHGILPALNSDSIEKGIITVTGALDGRHCLICVCDNGAGMDEESRRMLFSEKKHKNTTYGGYGLGNIRDRLAVLYGDEVSFNVRSRPGEGTEISFRIPLSGQWAAGE